MIKMNQFIRSFLFVPAASERLLASAIGKGSDCVILDLEDGTHRSQKNVAREGLPEAIRLVKAAGKDSAVRINGDLLTAITDLRASVCSALDLIVLPKVEHPRDLELIDRVVTALEREADMKQGQVRFLLQIESAAALPCLHAIAAATPRNMGMMLGSEDFSLDCGCMPTPDALYVPSLMVLHAARAARIQPIGFVGSIANLGAPESFVPVVERARDLGFRGAVVVHPKFVDVVNQCYTPVPEELDRARQIVEVFEKADALGQGAIRIGDLMVDKPVYQRALTLLAEQGERVPSSDEQTWRPYQDQESLV
jgi:citrate lyase subunit beta / citryl-CoA lyase